MKLRTLAIAVAMASVPFAAQADVTVSGDIGVGYMTSSETIGEFGSEINFDASHTTNGLTYYGHAELEMDGSAIDELRVGVKSDRIGDIRFGHLGDNGCALVQVGGSYEVEKTHTIGGCQGGVENGVSYTRSMGKATVSVSHIPGTTDESSIGVAGTVGPVSASVGYTSGDATVEGMALGLAGTIGPVAVGFRYNKLDASGSEAVHGINAQYTTASGLSVYGGLQTSDAAAGDDKSMSFGVKKVIGTTDIFFEMVDTGVAGADTDGIVGMRHRF